MRNLEQARQIQATRKSRIGLSARIQTMLRRAVRCLQRIEQTISLRSTRTDRKYSVTSAVGRLGVCVCVGEGGEGAQRVLESQAQELCGVLSV